MANNLGASLISIIPTLFLLGATVALVREFQGKEYDLDSTFRKKISAEKRAKELRKMDFKTRITKVSQDGRTGYAVYKRDESGFSYF